jgi:hypothetical protein
VYLGNVLIIQEKGDNEPLSCPDDSAAGGTISFDFCEPVICHFQAGQLLDVDGLLDVYCVSVTAVANTVNGQRQGYTPF